MTEPADQNASPGPPKGPADFEDRYQVLFEKSNDAIFVEDFNGRILDVNPKACQDLGYTRDELLAMNAAELVPPKIAARFPELAERIRAGEGFVEEALNRRKDGTLMPTEVSGSLVHLDGEPYLLILSRDISDRISSKKEIHRQADELRQANAQLRLLNERLQSQNREIEARSNELEDALARLQQAETWLGETEKLRSLGTMAGGMAHEFNNILGGIMGCASYLEMSEAIPSEEKTYITMILDASRRASNLTQQVLGVARRIQAEPKPFAINEVVEEVVQLISRTFPRTIRVHCELGDRLPQTVGIRAQIHQAILNLCINARDAMPRGGQIALATKAISGASPSCNGNGSVCVSVADTGEGMTPEIRDRIFESFFTTKKDSGGTGLGLSLVQSILRDHGGSIDVHSAPGKGTRFDLYLPTSNGKARTPSEARPIPPIKGSGTVLVVDDEPLNRTVMRKILAGAGYEVLLADSGQQALSTIAERKGDLDLVLLDLIMPGMDGEEVYTALRGDFPNLPVVILTGMADDRLANRLLDAGVSEFVYKPLDARQILKVIDRVMR